MLRCRIHTPGAPSFIPRTVKDQRMAARRYLLMGGFLHVSVGSWGSSNGGRGAMPFFSPALVPVELGRGGGVGSLDSSSTEVSVTVVAMADANVRTVISSPSNCVTRSCIPVEVASGLSTIADANAFVAYALTMFRIGVSFTLLVANFSVLVFAARFRHEPLSAPGC